MKNVLRGLEGLTGVVANVEMEKLVVAANEAKKVNVFGSVLSEEAIKELTWTVDAHIGNIIGHYYANEGSLVGMTTYAGEILMAISTKEEVLYAIADEYLAKDGKGKAAYVSQFTDADMANLTGLRGLGAKIVVVKGEAHAEMILNALKNWNVVDATEEEVAAFVGDVTRMIRACQEIEIDITKDKTLVRFMDLADMLRAKSYILTHKFRIRKTKTNPGLVTNVRELQAIKTVEERKEAVFTVECGWLKYQVGSEVIAEDVADRAEVIDKNTVKITNKDLVDGGIMDSGAKFQERLMDKGIKSIAAITTLAQMSETDYVITETLSDIENNTLPEAVLDLAQDMAPVTKAGRDYDRIIVMNKLADKKGLRSGLTNSMRTTNKKLWMANNDIHNAINAKTLAAMESSFRRVFSKAVVASELVSFDEKTKTWGFEMRQSIPTVKNLCKAEYLTLAVENQMTEFVVAEHPTFGIANDVVDSEVTVVARNIMKDGAVIGRIITDKLSKNVVGRKFYIERNAEGVAVLVEKMSIVAMGAFPSEETIIVPTDMIEFDEFTKENLMFNGKKQDVETIAKNRAKYIEIVKEILTDVDTDATVNYSYALNAIVVNGTTEFKLVKNSDTWKNMMMGLVSNPALSPEDNKKVNHAKATELVAKGYIVKDVFFTGKKLAMVLAAK